MLYILNRIIGPRYSRTFPSARLSHTGQLEVGSWHLRNLIAWCSENGTTVCALPELRVYYSELTRSTVHAFSRPSLLVLALGSAHWHVRTSGFASVTRSCGLPSAACRSSPRATSPLRVWGSGHSGRPSWSCLPSQRRPASAPRSGQRRPGPSYPVS